MKKPHKGKAKPRPPQDASCQHTTVIVEQQTNYAYCYRCGVKVK